MRKSAMKLRSHSAGEIYPFSEVGSHTFPIKSQKTYKSCTAISDTSCDPIVSQFFALYRLFKIFCKSTNTPLKNLLSPALNVEFEKQHVPVLYDILFAFHPVESFIPG